MDNQIFQALIAKGISEEKAKQYSNDISKIMLGYLYFDIAPRLSPEEDAQFAPLIKHGDIEGVVALVKSKYSDEQFAKFLEEKIDPLIDDYISDVLEK